MNEMRVLAINSLSTIDSLKKKLFRQDNIYNSFRLKETTRRVILMQK